MNTNIGTKLDEILEKLNSSEITISNSIYADPLENNAIFHSDWKGIKMNSPTTDSDISGTATATTSSLTLHVNVPERQYGKGCGVVYCIYQSLLSLTKFKKIIIDLIDKEVTPVEFEGYAHNYLFLMDKNTPLKSLPSQGHFTAQTQFNPKSSNMPHNEYVLFESLIEVESHDMQTVEIDITDLTDDYYLGFSIAAMQRGTGSTGGNKSTTHDCIYYQIRFE